MSKEKNELKKYYIEVSGTFVATAEVIANSEEEAKEKYYFDLDFEKDFGIDFSKEYVSVWEQ